MKKIFKVIKLLIIIGVSGVVFVESFMLFMTFFVRGGEIRVPDLRNMPKQAAIDKVKKLTLKPEIMYQEDEIVEYNHIALQDPLPGEIVKKRHKIKLLISSGIGRIQVPDLTDMNLENAEVVLKGVNLTIGQISNVRNNYSGQNQILAQDPEPGEIVDAETPIDLVVNLGPDIDYVYVLDFTGQNYRFISDIINNLCLRCRMKEYIADGVIVKQDVMPGKIVPYNTLITFDVKRIKMRDESRPLQFMEESESDTDTETINTRPKNVFISYSAPGGFISRKLEIVIKDCNGKRTIFKGSIAPGQKIEKIITLCGRYRIYYYLDEKLVRTDKR